MKQTLIQRIQSINSIIKQVKNSDIEPYHTTEGALNRGEVGKHRGVYYIYPEKNFYFGLAKGGKGGTVFHRNQTHRPKLDVNLTRLYGNPIEKKQARWTFPENWKEGVCKYIIKGADSIPSHSKKTKTGVKPGVLEFKVVHKVEIDTLPVIVWNLDNFKEKEIKKKKKKVITTIWPYCNFETYKKRRKAIRK